MQRTAAQHSLGRHRRGLTSPPELGVGIDDVQAFPMCSIRGYTPVQHVRGVCELIGAALVARDLMALARYRDTPAQLVAWFRAQWAAILVGGA
jgi:hypothetical protein